MIKESIYHLIMAHTILLDKTTKLSQEIKKSSFNNQIDHIKSISDNRDQLISIISGIQKKIELFAGKLSVKEEIIEISNILKIWKEDINSWMINIFKIDEETTTNLLNQKEETVKEIATIFKGKQKFEGYNIGYSYESCRTWSLPD